MNFARLALAALALLSLPTTAPTQTHGALLNPTGRPIGGGEGYGDWVAGGTVVATRTQLIAALQAAQAGAVVYVHDNASIDVSGLSLELRAGVTLASGRGRNGSLGGLLYSNHRAYQSTFLVRGTGVRITGLRLRGPDTGIEPGDCGDNDATGIEVAADTWSIWFVRVDNNELWGWPNSAVGTRNVWGVQVTHSHIHHNRRQVRRSGCRAYGLGYGVCVSTSGHALIEANLFDHNRHDIACDGAPGTAYEARYNLILPGGVQHSFDVHGGADRRDGTDIAGTLFWVHHNTFLQSDKPAFRIRGVPIAEARVWGNEFRHGSAGDAADQTNASGNFLRYDNLTGVNRLPGWFVSFSGSSFWRFRRFDGTSMAAVHLADFDGDRCADAFRSSGGSWQVSRKASSAWETINGSSAPASSLRFGDFDGDGRTDVFRTNNGAWQVSFGGTGFWTTINGSSVALGSLGFADFNGDRRTDVFYGNGSRWYVSWSGTSAWTQINVANNVASGLAFADLNGDRRADVFWTDGATWRVSWSGTSMWQAINSAAAPLASLALADFDGDGRADVFHADGARWRVSWSGTSYWHEVQQSSLPTSALRFADVNGDGKADVLSTQSP
jgi:hypothetical protein